MNYCQRCWYISVLMQCVFTNTYTAHNPYHSRYVNVCGHRFSAVAQCIVATTSSEKSSGCRLQPCLILTSTLIYCLAIYTPIIINNLLLYEWDELLFLSNYQLFIVNNKLQINCGFPNQVCLTYLFTSGNTWNNYETSECLRQMICDSWRGQLWNLSNFKFATDI